MSQRKLRPYILFGFVTTHDALAAEEVLKKTGIPVSAVPTPSSLAGGLCGIALRIEPVDSDRVRAQLADRGIDVRAEVEMGDF